LGLEYAPPSPPRYACAKKIDSMAGLLHIVLLVRPYPLAKLFL